MLKLIWRCIIFLSLHSNKNLVFGTKGLASLSGLVGDGFNSVNVQTNELKDKSTNKEPLMEEDSVNVQPLDPMKLAEIVGTIGELVGRLHEARSATLEPEMIALLIKELTKATKEARRVLKEIQSQE